jgi:predicted secreted Zn-dependent protease
MQMVRPFLLASMLTGAAVAAGPVAAAPSILANVDYYDVTGETGAELVREMSRLGPPDLDKPGERFWARLGWRVNWQYRYAEADGTCGITNATLTVRLDFIYPRWANFDDGPPDLQALWGPFMEATRKHEQQHAKHGTDAALAIEAMLLGHERMPTCTALQQSADARAHEIADAASAKDVEYDRLTQHGLTEGISLPTMPVPPPGQGAAGAGRADGGQRVGIGLSPR